MKTIMVVAGIISPVLKAGSGTLQMNSLDWYLAGAIIALFLLAYLMYSLIKPEKF